MTAADETPEGACDLVASVVLFHTPLEEVERTVRAALDARANVQVVLVDNSVPPMALPDFDRSRVTVVRTGRNLGYGRAHNIAIRMWRGRCRYHLVLNSDIRFDGEALDQMIAFMDVHPDAGLAMPKVYYPDGRLQHLCRLLPDPLDLFGRGFLRNSDWSRRRSERYEFHSWPHDRVEAFPFLSGCFMLMRSTVLAKVDGFDERFFLYGEDIDLSRRIHTVASTLFVPSVSIIHEYRSEQAPSLRRTLHKTVNLSRYFNKWGWLFDARRKAINRQTLARVFGAR